MIIDDYHKQIVDMDKVINEGNQRVEELLKSLIEAIKRVSRKKYLIGAKYAI
jgi:hypothetical protein